MNTLDLESAAIVANALPTYMPGSTAYFLDTRAKRIVKLIVLKSVIEHSLTNDPEEKDRRFIVGKKYICDTGIGELPVDEAKMIPSFKEDSYQLGLLLLD